ncbi:hypothetical protein [Streptomyces sp. E-08]|uniref:hypothetical protein n=1 Tax=Streptomyces sp. E-08 TaxID=3404047 RepID=UPI003CECDE8C
MPTITVETTVDDPHLHRRFAKNLSLWLRGEGVDINHVITKFVTADPRQVFSGPFPLDGGTGAHFAFVHCTVGETRPTAFLDRLAGRVVGELAPHVAPERIFIQFVPVRPELHRVGTELLNGVASHG